MKTDAIRKALAHAPSGAAHAAMDEVEAIEYAHRKVTNDAPSVFTATLKEKHMTPKPQQIMQFFRYAHLREDMQAVSKPFGVLAEHLVSTLPDNAEREAALRDLLKSKDAAVRASIARDQEWDEFTGKWVDKGAKGPAINSVPVGA